MTTSARVSRGWAFLLSVIGYAFVALGVIAAALTWLVPGGLERQFPSANIVLVKLGASGAFVLVGLLLATPFVVAGELIRIMLDQRKLLARIDRRLAALESRPVAPDRGSAPDRASTLVDRLRPRG